MTSSKFGRDSFEAPVSTGRSLSRPETFGEQPDHSLPNSGLRQPPRAQAAIPFVAVVAGDELRLLAPLAELSATDREHRECERLDHEHQEAVGDVE